MSVQITDKCVTCGACEWECPSEAISPGAMRPVVDLGRCTECFGFFGESQCIVVCPVDAIQVEAREEESALLARFLHLYPNRKPADTAYWVRSDRGA